MNTIFRNSHQGVILPNPDLIQAMTQNILHDSWGPGGLHQLHQGYLIISERIGRRKHQRNSRQVYTNVFPLFVFVHCPSQMSQWRKPCSIPSTRVYSSRFDFSSQSTQAVELLACDPLELILYSFDLLLIELLVVLGRK